MARLVLFGAMLTGCINSEDSNSAPDSSDTSAVSGRQELNTATVALGATSTVEIVFDRLQVNECGWTSSDAVGAFSDFLNAFNQGDTQRMRLFFPDIPSWAATVQGPDMEPVRYSVATADGPNDSSFEFQGFAQEEIIEYALGRHEKDERLELLLIGIGSANTGGIVHLDFELMRSAADLPESMRVTGKAGIQCADGTITIINYMER